MSKQKSLKWFTVAGYYPADEMQRYTDHIRAHSADEAEGIAVAKKDKQDEEVFIVSVFKGKHKAQESKTYVGRETE